MWQEVQERELFARGGERRRRGDREHVLALWHAAYLCDPGSFVIRKVDPVSPTRDVNATNTLPSGSAG